jgi:hypothetical protein
MKGFECVDCGVNTSDIEEYYMVTHSVWAASGMTPSGGMLCVGCLETRLGRPLAAADFLDCNLNKINYGPFTKSRRLLDRMTTEQGPTT